MQQFFCIESEGGRMGEIMRWRLARSAQRRIPAELTLLRLDGNGAFNLSSSTLRRLQSLQQGPDVPAYGAYRTTLQDVASVTAYLTTASPARPAAGPVPAGPGALSPGVIAAFVALIELDRWLASQENKPLVADLDTEVAGLLGSYVGTPTWTTIHTVLYELFYAALIIAGMLGAAQTPPLLTEALSWLCRMILVVGVVDLEQQAPSPLQQPGDIYSALRWRTPVLPDAVALILTFIRARNEAVIVRKPGFADLYITREEWDHYEPAEIASIENILAHETKSHVHVLRNETQVATTVDTTTTTVKEQDTTTTDLSQLQEQSSSDISIAAHVNGQVDVSGSYGPTQVSTHLGGSLDYSSASATSRSITQSHETVSRAVTRVEQTTRQIRTVSTLTESVDKEKHEFKNDTDSKVVGIYRWVDQIQNVELDRYPHRFLMEFELPEPGAWTRWLHLNDTARAMVNQLPPPLTVSGNAGDPPLYPNEISDLPRFNAGGPDYRIYVARYNIQGVGPSPAPTKVVAVNLSFPTSGSDPKTDKVLDRYLSDSTLAVPDGYTASTWSAEGSAIFSDAGLDGHTGPDAVDIQITVGGGNPVAIGTTNGLITTPPAGNPVGTITDGSIPIGVTVENAEGIELNIAVTCTVNQDVLDKWQNDTYSQIVAAYAALNQAYYDEKAGLSVTNTNIAQGGSPTQNAMTISQELKRQVIEMLTGTQFQGVNAINWYGNSVNPPATILLLAAQAAPFVQFMEEAFEWETLSYICYPYYWGAAARWPDLAPLAGDDPNYADFLRAGSARVVLAARPGFEDQVNFYVAYGILWGGGPMPAPGDENYLSIADEIKAQQQRPLDVSVMDAWQVRLPTTLVWLENNDGLPSNPDPTILVITKVFPRSGNVGDRVVITGSNFGDAPDSSTLLFNGTTAVPTLWSEYSITAPVPAGATSGDIVLVVNGLTSNAVSFIVGAPGAAGPRAVSRAVARRALNRARRAAQAKPRKKRVKARKPRPGGHGMGGNG
jgi:hypothetical protein